MPSAAAPPLAGIKVIEFAGLAPGPFCGLFLADWGASVIRVDRASPKPTVSLDLLARGKRSVALNLKSSTGIQLAKKLITEADVLIDPFRPGVLEKLGLGPDVFLGEEGLNKRLIYTRVVGFARRGYHKDMAGHDINYLAISGVLSLMTPIPPDGRPAFPINILGDFAGGGHMAATGVILALFERSKSRLGQIVETDMVSGARYVSSMPLIGHILRTPAFNQATGSNLLDGGAPFYNVYRCKDGKYVSLGALEPQFYVIFLNNFLESLPKDFSAKGWKPTPQKQGDRTEWDDLRRFIAEGFMTKTRDEWAQVFDGKDACVAPVLTPEEATTHTTTSSPIPQPHPDLSRTPAPGSIPGPSNKSLGPSLNIASGLHTEQILEELGLSKEERIKLAKEGVVAGVLKAAL
ncbi:hypothetical protein M422DRAFT_156403 [Sphaerobolus stellatus SS14]|nr:hypothetical protein M422DRAFT_156403 [Sphaerobolus stellatus SS14]